MEKHYALIHACLQLAQKSNQRSSCISAVSLTMSSSSHADEVVGLLVDAGLFDVAIRICQLFHLKMDVIFEHLTVRCLQNFCLSWHFGVGRQKYRMLCS